MGRYFYYWPACVWEREWVFQLCRKTNKLLNGSTVCVSLLFTFLVIIKESYFYYKITFLCFLLFKIFIFDRSLCQITIKSTDLFYFNFLKRHTKYGRNVLINCRRWNKMCVCVRACKQASYVFGGKRDRKKKKKKKKSFWLTKLSFLRLSFKQIEELKSDDSFN